MRVIRRGVFETNSSSTHSITMCSKEDYDKWERGEMLLYEDEFITREDAIKELKKDEWFNKNYPEFDFTDEEAVNEALADNNYQTVKQYFNDDLEGFEDSYTTINGEVIIAFGKYGYDS